MASSRILSHLLRSSASLRLLKTPVAFSSPRFPSPAGFLLSRAVQYGTSADYTAKVFGSVVEAKNRVNALSTTTYHGSQCFMDEATSEKLRGDKYENVVITPRPPPMRYGSGRGRYNDRNMNYDQPRQRQYGNRNMNYDQQGSAPQDGRGFGSPPQDGRGYGQPLQNGRGYGQPKQGGTPRLPLMQSGRGRYNDRNRNYDQSRQRQYSDRNMNYDQHGSVPQDGSGFGQPQQGGRGYGQPQQGGRGYGQKPQDGRGYGQPPRNFSQGQGDYMPRPPADCYSTLSHFPRMAGEPQPFIPEGVGDEWCVYSTCLSNWDVSSGLDDEIYGYPDSDSDSD